MRNTKIEYIKLSNGVEVLKKQPRQPNIATSSRFDAFERYQLKALKPILLELEGLIKEMQDMIDSGEAGEDCANYHGDVQSPEWLWEPTVEYDNLVRKYYDKQIELNKAIEETRQQYQQKYNIRFSTSQIYENQDNLNEYITSFEPYN